MRIISLFAVTMWLLQCNMVAQKPESFTAQAGKVAHYTQDAELGKVYVGLFDTNFTMHYDAREQRVTINEGGNTINLEGVLCQYQYHLSASAETYKKVWKLEHPDYGAIIFTRTNFGDMVLARPTYGGDAELNYYATK